MKRLLPLVFLLLAPPAAADHSDANLPWPQALSPQEVSAAVQPRPVRNCRRARVKCIDGLIARLRRQWRKLDAACDHRALWPLAYIRITQGLRNHRFRDRRWMTYVITHFSNKYFDAYRAYERGGPLPESWRITFDAAREGDANGGQDVLLASNAHTQRDLPFVYAEMGMRSPNGRSHKPDHDAVNDVNTRVFDGLEDEFAERYDPFFTWIDLKPSPLDELGTQELVKGWREGAWRNGERLLNADNAAERAEIAAQIEQNATLWARAISEFTQPGHRATRDAHCRSAKLG